MRANAASLNTLPVVFAPVVAANLPAECTPGSTAGERSAATSDRFAAANVAPYTPATIHSAGCANATRGFRRNSAAFVATARNTEPPGAVPAEAATTARSTHIRNGATATAAAQPETIATSASAAAGTYSFSFAVLSTKPPMVGVGWGYPIDLIDRAKRRADR